MVSHGVGCLQLDAVSARPAPLPVILLFVVFVGLCDGVAQGAIFGDVALLPPKYTQVRQPAHGFHIHPSFIMPQKLECIMTLFLVETCDWASVHTTEVKGWLPALAALGLPLPFCLLEPGGSLIMSFFFIMRDVIYFISFLSATVLLNIHALDSHFRLSVYTCDLLAVVAACIAWMVS